MNLDDALGEAFLREERRYLRTLIALKLNDLSEFLVFYEGAVTRKFLKSQDLISKSSRSVEHAQATLHKKKR